MGKSTNTNANANEGSCVCLWFTQPSGDASGRRLIPFSSGCLALGATQPHKPKCPSAPDPRARDGGRRRAGGRASERASERSPRDNGEGGLFGPVSSDSGMSCLECAGLVPLRRPRALVRSSSSSCGQFRAPGRRRASVSCRASVLDAALQATGGSAHGILLLADMDPSAFQTLLLTAGVLTATSVSLYFGLKVPIPGTIPSDFCQLKSLRMSRILRILRISTV